MDVSQLRLVVLSRRYLYGGGRELPRGFRFSRHARTEHHRIVAYAKKLQNILLKDFHKFGMRYGKQKMSVTGVSASLSTEAPAAPGQRVANLAEAVQFGRSTEVEVLLVNLSRNHARTDYWRLFASFFPSAPTTTVSPLTVDDALRFLRRCIRSVVPMDFFGSSENFEKFVRDVLPHFLGHRQDQLSMACVLGGLDFSVMKDESTAEKRDGYYGMSFIFSIGWLISAYLTPLLATFFYITETRESYGRLQVYLKVPYLAGCSREVQRLVDENMLEPIPFAGYSAVYFNVDLRFLPKGDGGWRMLCVFPKKDTESRSRMYGLKKRVNPILRSAQSLTTDIVSSTLDQIYCSWLDAVMKARVENKKLYFVKMDVAGAYPNMKPEILREALNRLLAPVNRSAGLIVDVERTCVRWRSKWFRLKKGIPQGSFPMSAFLCDLYYAHVLSSTLPDFRRDCLKEDEVFVRYLDDILFASTDKERVIRFLEQAKNAASSPAGVKFNTAKSITNLENLHGAPCCVAKTVVFCGSRLNPAVPVIRPLAINEPPVYIRCPLFTQVGKHDLTWSDEKVVEEYLRSRSKVMNNRIKWRWHVRDLDRRDQKVLLRRVCLAGFRTFFGIVTKTGAICFGTESAIWLKYADVVAELLTKIVHQLVALYVSSSRSSYGACSSYEAGMIAVNALLKLLTTCNRRRTSEVTKRVRQMKHEGTLLPIKCKRSKSQRNSGRLPPLDWPSRPLIDAENAPPSDEELPKLSPEDFIVKASNGIAGRKTCLLCDAKLKSDVDVLKHVGGKFHRERFASLSADSNSLTSSSDEHVAKWDEAFAQKDRELRLDPEVAITHAAAANEIIHVVSEALRLFACTPDGLKCPATKIVRLGALAEPYWAKTGSNLACGINVRCPWDEDKFDQFACFFTARVTPRFSEKGLTITRTAKFARFVVSSLVLDEPTKVVFFLATNKSDDRKMGRNGNHMIISRQEWMDENEIFVVGPNDVLMSTTAIVRLLRHLTAGDDVWNSVHAWHWNVLAIWALRKEERRLRLGEAIRMIFAYIAARFDRSCDVILLDPLRKMPLVHSAKEGLSERAKKMVGIIDAGDIEAMLGEKAVTESKRKAEGPTGEDEASKRAKVDA